ncbi:Nucleoside-diphosphate-sugar epimerases [hydrothermal vent metagenome]|uniref:Nucleoside-diphosphate-sugar epimerases n=1 Tax=hydrothermal vent metagenome TaxID=652676 RepID=A0A3B0Y313_9ZZZZ
MAFNVKTMPEHKLSIAGCGYIGKKIARLLMAKNRQPDCFVLSKHSKKTCESIGLNANRLDLDMPDMDMPDMDGVESNNTFENSSIAYLVAPPAQGRTDTRMQHFISMLEKKSIAPEKIILISTTGIYGDCNGRWIDETQAEKPQADRAYRRLSAESQLKKYCKTSQVKYIILRVPGIYAADRLPLQRITSGKPIVKAENSGYTNRIHADDLAAFCVEALVSSIEQGIYNCCDGHPSTMHDYFTRVADAMGLARPDEISLQQAQQELSAGMLSYLAESKRISNKKLLKHFKTELRYPDLTSGLKNLNLN